MNLQWYCLNLGTEPLTKTRCCRIAPRFPHQHPLPRTEAAPASCRPTRAYAPTVSLGHRLPQPRSALPAGKLARFPFIHPVRRWANEPLSKAYGCLGGIGRCGSTLLPPGFLAEYVGCPRPFSAHKTIPSPSKERADGLSSHTPYQSLDHS